MSVKVSSIGFFAVVVSMLMSGFANGADSGKFTYNPGDSLEYRGAQSIVTIIDLGVEGAPTVRTAGEMVKDVVIKKLRGKYVLTSTPVSSSYTVNGQQSVEPIFWVIANSTEKSIVTKKGEIKKVTGYSEKVEEIKGNLDAESLESYGDVLNEQYFIDVVTSNWDASVTYTLGKSTQKGTEWTHEMPMDGPNGEKWVSKVDNKVGASVSCNRSDKSRSCVEIFYVYKLDDKKNGPTDAVVSAKGKRIVDPNTMMIYLDETEMQMNASVTIQGQTFYTKNSIKSEYTAELKQ